MNAPTIATGAVDPADRRRLLREVLAAWPDLTEQGVASLRNRGELVMRVKARYDLSAIEAGRDVDRVLKGRPF